jgi:hypothetical protein
MVEGTPFGAAVDEVVIDDKPAALADQFCTLIVMDELTATALRTDGLRVVLGFFLVFFLFYPCFERFTLRLEDF